MTSHFTLVDKFKALIRRANGKSLFSKKEDALPTTQIAASWTTKVNAEFTALIQSCKESAMSTKPVPTANNGVNKMTTTHSAIEVEAAKITLFELINQVDLTLDDLTLLRVLVITFWGTHPGALARQALDNLAPGFSDDRPPVGEAHQSESQA